MKYESFKIKLRLCLVMFLLQFISYLIVLIVSLGTCLFWFLKLNEDLILWLSLIVSLVLYIIIQIITYKLYYKFESRIIKECKRDDLFLDAYVLPSWFSISVFLTPMFFVIIYFVIFIGNYVYGVSTLMNLYVYVPFSILSSFKFLIKNKRK